MVKAQHLHLACQSAKKLSNFVKNERINLVPYTLLNFYNYFDHVFGWQTGNDDAYELYIRSKCGLEIKFSR